jgi:hypothetical protein
VGNGAPERQLREELLEAARRRENDVVLLRRLDRRPIGYLRRVEREILGNGRASGELEVCPIFTSVLGGVVRYQDPGESLCCVENR